MTTEDSRAQYLASGATEGGESHERLDLIRDVLSADATWAEPPPQVADGLLAALAVEAVPGPAMNQQRSGRWALVLAGAGRSCCDRSLGPGHDERHSGRG